MSDFVIVTDDILNYYPDSELSLETLVVVDRDEESVYVKFNGQVIMVEREFCVDLPF